MVVAVQNVIIQCFHVVFELISIQFKQHSSVCMANVLSCLQISNHSYPFFHSIENTYIATCPIMVMGAQIIIALCSLCIQLHKKLELNAVYLALIYVGWFHNALPWQCTSLGA